MEEKGNIYITLSILELCFAVFMSLPFLVPHCGFFALFGIVPLLCMEYIAENAKIRRFYLWHYSAFVLWNAATTFWVCNATLGGGLFAIFANALQMSLIFGLFRFSKKYFRGILPYLFLMAAWIAWERYYLTSAQISWPWLVLGNAFARTTYAIQWYSITGSLGGSLWIWGCNLSIFGLMISLAEGRFQVKTAKAQAIISTGLVILLFAPVTYSLTKYFTYKESTETLHTVIVQPNIDPYNKFTALTQQEQNDILLEELESKLKTASKDYILAIAPETFTNDIITNEIDSSFTVKSFHRFLQNYPNTDLLFGASSYTLIDSDVRPSETARMIYDNKWVESHNSAIVMNSAGKKELYHKSKLVVGVELMPYPKFFRKIDEKLGGVMGRCVGQLRPTVLHAGNVPIGCAICYESIYGDFCRGYVNDGAKALVVITNDAWWGDTPGYKQHLSYACLRAIELGRDIARCGNTGISAYINGRGDIVAHSSWWKRENLIGDLHLSDNKTIFAEVGDISGRICSLMFILLLLMLFVRLLTNNLPK